MVEERLLVEFLGVRREWHSFQVCMSYLELKSILISLGHFKFPVFSEIDAEELIWMTWLLLAEVDFVLSLSLEFAFRHVKESATMHSVFISTIHLFSTQLLVKPDLVGRSQARRPVE